MSPAFHSAHASDENWRQAVDACLERLGTIPPAANLGFLYVTDKLVDDIESILDRLRC